jgi:hypothetical protein
MFVHCCTSQFFSFKRDREMRRKKIGERGKRERKRKPVQWKKEEPVQERKRKKENEEERESE